MKKGIHYWALPKEMNLAQKFRFAKKCGYDGVELVILLNGGLSVNASKTELHQLKSIASSEGIEIPSLTNSFSWSCSFTSNYPEVRSKAFEVLKRQIDIAFELGVGAVLALPGFVSLGFEANELHPATNTSLADSYNPSTEIIQYDLAYERAVTSFKAISDYAQSANVIVCIENIWSKFLLSPLEMRNFIDEIGSPYVANYFDAGNVNPFGIPQHWIHILGHRIERVHIKDYRNGYLSLDGFVNLGEGDMDLQAVAKALQSVGYDGWVTVEVNADQENPKRIALAASKVMNKIFMVGGN